MLTYTLHQTHLPLRFPLSLDGWNYYLISCVASTKEGNKIVAFHLFTKTFSHERRTKSHLFSVSRILRFIHLSKVGGWQLKFINSWMSWCEHNNFFFLYMSFFSTTNGLFTLYTYCIGEKLVKCFAQKTIVLLCKSSKLIEVRWEICYWKK